MSEVAVHQPQPQGGENADDRHAVDVQVCLTVIVPVYNEAETILQVLERLATLDMTSLEIVVVDDGSTDGTRELLREAHWENIRVIFQEKNAGKTAAVRQGIAVAQGEYVIVQDADLEYDPREIETLLVHSQQHAQAVVFGKRPSYWNRPSRWVFATGVLVIDIAIFLVYGRFVRDHATCYKLLPRDVLRRLQLESNGFEGCIEITTKLLRLKVPIRQVPITYQPRAAEEGKKLTLAYGWPALKSVFRWRRWTPGD